MCGRFGLFARLNAIQDYFDAEFTYDYETRYNIAPEGKGIAAVQNESSDEINLLSWGIRPHWVDDPDDWHHPINARAETVAEKPSFRDTFKKRRCLIPASNFYESTGREGSRRPFFISVEDRNQIITSPLSSANDQTKSYEFSVSHIGGMEIRFSVHLPRTNPGRSVLEPSRHSLLEPSKDTEENIEGM